jgi:molybdopterin-guanine dinucleotide biosynthesis protein A
MGARAVAALAPNCERVVAVSEDPAAKALGVEVRPDLVRGLGPLAGIATALAWAEELGLEGVFVLACDLPLVSAEVVSKLIREWSDEDAVAPFGPRGFEPLCALYSVPMLPSVRTLLSRGELSPSRLLATARVRSLPVDEARGAGGVRDPFMNVNTPEDHARAEAALAGLPGP